MRICMCVYICINIYAYIYTNIHHAQWERVQRLVNVLPKYIQWQQQVDSLKYQVCFAKETYTSRAPFKRYLHT